MSGLIQVGILIVATATVWLVANKTQAPKMKIDFPTAHALHRETSFKCRALMESDLTASAAEHLTNGIEGKVYSGRNDLSITRKDSTTLTFLSLAAADRGLAIGGDFSIVQENDTELVASFFSGQAMNTFVLNKKNGLAILSRIRSTFPVYDAPNGGQTYLTCGGA